MNRHHASVVLAEPYAFRTEVSFTGEWRHVSDRSLRMLNHHARLQADAESAAEFVAGFRSEIRVQEKDRYYWLPLSESLVGDFDRVIKPQQKVTVYCLLLGGESNQWTTVVTAFHSESKQTPRPSQRWTSF